MAELKTRKTGASVKGFLRGISDEKRRKDCLAVLALMKRITRAEPRMWGPGIVGFGTYRYRYESGREGDWFLTGFSPRKQNLTIYLMSGFGGYEGLLGKLGPHKTGGSCLYLKSLAEVDMTRLEELIKRSVAHLRNRYAS